MIQVEGLTKRYASAVAVDDISFQVEKGQIVGFLGPNGAGKTTTMRILTCFMPPTGGTANVAGYDCVTQPLEVKKRIGYLPETPPLYPDMSVDEYLTFVGALKGIPKAELTNRVGEVTRRCAISDVRGKLIAKLSKGYRQRVGLAQAIIHNPDVLILDEPTSGFDPKQIIETRDLIKSLAGEHTIILSTHILSEVEAMCERVIIIAKGKIVAQDTMESLAARMRGAGVVEVEIEPRGGTVDADEVSRKLSSVIGVARVTHKSTKDNRARFEVETGDGRHIRGDVARAVVEAGWNLNELHSATLSLEEIFLQVTGSNAPAAVEGENAQ
jgi:ABC-2 type transport system ATP-binding protein